MECTKCDREAGMHAAYSGSYLCERHFLESVERRVKRRVREDDLLPRSATPENPQTWLIGLSGGKDSVVLTQLLHETFADDPRVELVALTVHEGIEGYRDKSLAACEELVADLDIEHEVVSYAEEFDLEMDGVVDSDPEGMAACAYCGVFRRDLLAPYASLGPFGERAEPDGMTPRAKPLRDVPEKEVGLYAQLRDLPGHTAECPHSSEAFRGEIQDLLLSLEDAHPGTRHSVMAGYEEIAAMAAERHRSDESDLNECETCGAPTTRDVCRKCRLVDAVHAAE